MTNIICPDCKCMMVWENQVTYDTKGNKIKTGFFKCPKCKIEKEADNE